VVGGAHTAVAGLSCVALVMAEALTSQNQPIIQFAKLHYLRINFEAIYETRTRNKKKKKKKNHER